MEGDASLGKGGATEEGWTTVSYRKTARRSNQSRADVAGNLKFRSSKRLTTFFFSHFSDNHGAKEMVRIFKMYGEAVEVVIPSKRDKLGRRFGFARFWNVMDPDSFVVRLDNIIIGSTKIYVNYPRYFRDQTRYEPKKVQVASSKNDD